MGQFDAVGLLDIGKTMLPEIGAAGLVRSDSATTGPGTPQIIMTGPKRPQISITGPHGPLTKKGTVKACGPERGENRSQHSHCGWANSAVPTTNAALTNNQHCTASNCLNAKKNSSPGNLVDKPKNQTKSSSK